MNSECRSPFESPSRYLISWRQIVRLVRNALIVGAVVVLLIDQVGEPLLRWEYRYRRGDPDRRPLAATYYGLSGRYESCQQCYSDGLPVVLFAQPEPPLWRRAADKVRSLLP
ncbi:hypothetical protein [Botrimarina hoheduenensis]|uniref:Uncharacterized protein n=1 Tax=Botrimarina hoheduenensis TaxID=2528000 RepID=A0A5C5VYH3_9BACT|nr:hypothetical protein [Botrimarina hoheduenensis]TWT43474.1 hypothetical protein Pla111_24250 [Botrimarina hoheduenensis]